METGRGVVGVARMGEEKRRGGVCSWGGIEVRDTRGMVVQGVAVRKRRQIWGGGGVKEMVVGLGVRRERNGIKRGMAYRMRGRSAQRI